MSRKMTRLWGFFIALSLLTIGPALTPVRAQSLFQNNDASCEEHALPIDLEFEDFSFDVGIACGRFNDDSAVIDPTHGGKPDFPDCATQADQVKAGLVSPFSNSILINTSAHGDNCVNAGGVNHQFETPQTLFLEEFGAMRMGSIAQGNLNGSEFADLVMVEGGFQLDDMASRALAFLFSEPGGGFGNPSNVSGQAELEPSMPLPFQTFPLNVTSGPINFAFVAERSLVLQNCDGDAVDEAVVTVVDGNASEEWGIMVVQNDGTALVDNPAPVFYQLPPMGEFSEDVLMIPLTQGDYNGDTIPDVIAVISNVDGTHHLAALCEGEGDCSYDCPTNILDDNARAFTAGLLSFSVVSGDFNGDGLLDVAIPEFDLSALTMNPDAGQIRYLLNNGMGLEDWEETVFPLEFPGGDFGVPFMIEAGRFTTTAVGEQIDEVAVTSVVSTLGGGSKVLVIPTDGQMGFDVPKQLSFTNPDTNFPLVGLDVADFDLCGGDDIATFSPVIPEVLGPEENSFSLFLNENEPPELTVAADNPTAVIPNRPTDFSVLCTDPTFDDRRVDWGVLSAPAGANTSFSPLTNELTGSAITATSAFETDTPGDYTLQVTCTDFCGLSKAVTIELSLDTQGGCVASLNGPTDGPDTQWFWLTALLAPLLRRRPCFRARA